MQWLVVVAVVFVGAWAVSTPEGRREARDKLKPYNPLFWIIAIILWAAILWPQ